MPTAQESQENRLLTFANVFKGYMGVMPIVTAALAPLLTALNVIPTYEAQRKPLAAMTGVLGFLLLAWLFYVRRTIALGSLKPISRSLINLCPLILVLCSVVCYIGYVTTLDKSLATVSTTHPAVSRTQALSNWSQDYTVPYSALLQLLYLGMFLCPEAAFVMMALREYTIDVLKLSECEWIFADQEGSKSPVELRNKIDNVQPLATQLK